MSEQRVTELVREIGQRGDVAAADQLPDALAALPPNEPTRTMLRRLLERPDLDGKADSWGVPCRAALISAQLAQGYPYALEVSPDDLAWLRTVTSERTDRVDLTRAWVMGLAMNSFGWNALWSSLASWSSDRQLLAAFLVATMHAAVAFLVAYHAQRETPLPERRRALLLYRLLAGMGALGPIVAFAMARSLTPGILVGLALAGPAMATAVACWVAGDRIAPEDR
jgi:hypothetical protein